MPGFRTRTFARARGADLDHADLVVLGGSLRGVVVLHPFEADPPVGAGDGVSASATATDTIAATSMRAIRRLRCINELLRRSDSAAHHPVRGPAWKARYDQTSGQLDCAAAQVDIIGGVAERDKAGGGDPRTSWPAPTSTSSPSACSTASGSDRSTSASSRLRDEVRGWVRWNIELVIRWLADDRAPSETEMERFRERARALAAAGMPADIVPANFRRGARFAWTALLAAAREDERPALLESADRLFEFIDRVSELFSDTYRDARAAARGLRRGAQRPAPADARGRRPSSRTGRTTGSRSGSASSWPPPTGRSCWSRRRTASSSTQASRDGCAPSACWRSPRADEWLGLAHDAVPWRQLGLGARGVIAEGETTPLRRAVGGVRRAAHRGRRRRRPGSVRRGARLDDHLGELLLRRSPRLASRVRARVYGRLGDHDPELTRTLDLLIEHDFDRAATAAALPVHRNTLGNRLNRIGAITGLDVDGADGRGLIWLAWLDRHASG